MRLFSLWPNTSLEKYWKTSHYKLVPLLWWGQCPFFNIGAFGLFPMKLKCFKEINLSVTLQLQQIGHNPFLNVKGYS